MKLTTARVVAAGAATAVIAGLGVGLAYADPTPAPSTNPTSAPSASPATPQKPGAKQHRAGRLMARALHGEATVGAKKPRTIVFQKGTVSAVDGKTLTVKSADGYTATYVISGDTKVRKQREDAKLSDVKASLKVRVVGTREPDQRTAKRIVLLRS